MSGCPPSPSPPACSGRLGKVTLGGGNKSGLYQVLNTDYSPRVAAECMNRLAKLRWGAVQRGGMVSEVWRIEGPCTRLRAGAQ